MLMRSRFLIFIAAFFLLSFARADFVQAQNSFDGGDLFSLAVKSDGTVLSWGYNIAGKPGDPENAKPRTTPTPVPKLTGVTAVGGGRALLSR